MKKIITPLLAFVFLVGAHAQTKEELIEQYLEVTDSKKIHNAALVIIENEARKIHEINGDPTNQVITIWREHLSWDNLKPDFISIIDETYTSDELKALIQYYDSIPLQIKQLQGRQTDIRIKQGLLIRQSKNEMLAEIKQQTEGQSTGQDPHTQTQAEIWMQLTQQEKSYYIKGVMDGTHSTSWSFYHAMKTQDQDILNKIGPEVEKNEALTASYDQLCRLANELYANPDNEHIPYRVILRIAEFRYRGEDISNNLIKARASANKKLNETESETAK